jgi:long-chain acyl-CoA synthetase
MPLFHSYAMAMGLFLCGYSGSTLVVQPGYHPQHLLDAIEREGITIFPGSPTIFTGLMQHEAFARTDWSHVHTCYSGSAALSRETLERWQAATGAQIFEGYGQTEAGPVLSFNPQRGPVKAGSVGIALAGTELQVVDPEQGTRVLPVGERGEIRARGPQVMRGYMNLPSETAEALRDGWLYTGDIGEFDADGYLFIRDRKKDLVIVGGYNVYPREVEEVLFAHPQVVDAAVVGQSDAYRGERLHAFVVLREGCTFDEEQLREYCAGQLARYKIPARIERLDALPKTSVNKTDKKVLKARVL